MANIEKLKDSGLTFAIDTIDSCIEDYQQKADCTSSESLRLQALTDIKGLEKAREILTILKESNYATRDQEDSTSRS